MHVPRKSKCRASVACDMLMGFLPTRLIEVRAHYRAHVQQKREGLPVFKATRSVIQRLAACSAAAGSCHKRTIKPAKAAGGLSHAPSCVEVFQDLLWSDPQEKLGWEANPRGAGIKPEPQAARASQVVQRRHVWARWGPDLTAAFLKRTGISRMWHMTKPSGQESLDRGRFEVDHPVPPAARGLRLMI